MGVQTYGFLVAVMIIAGWQVVQVRLARFFYICKNKAVVWVPIFSATTVLIQFTFTLQAVRRTQILAVVAIKKLLLSFQLVVLAVTLHMTQRLI